MRENQVKGQICMEQLLLKDEAYPDKPPWVLIRGSKRLWCPHCKDVTLFKKDHDLGVPRCSECGMSMRDFHVRQTNRLFTKEALK